MIPHPPPIYPLPPQGLNQSDEDYQRAKDDHQRRLEARNEAMKSDAAFLIVMAGTLILVLSVMVVMALFIAGGVRAILYALAASGLLWVAYVQVRRRL